MRHIITIVISLVLLFVCSDILAQTSPPTEHHKKVNLNLKKSMFQSDTIDFEAYPDNTEMTIQYLNQGVTFSGYDGSDNPLIYDYGAIYTKILHSDDWYNPFRINFVDTINGTSYQLAQKIEFDNPVDSQIDYMSIDVYDSINTLIYHYVSASPEHITIDFESPTAAYIVVDDSAGTAYVVDNILVDFGNPNTTNLSENQKKEFNLYPNPTFGIINCELMNRENIKLTIYNLSGKTIIEETALNKNGTIDLTNFKSGIYIIHIQADNETFTTKIVKE